MRRIAVFTGGRADLWPLMPVLELLQDDPRCETVLLVSGTHLAESFGATHRDVDLPGVEVEEIPVGVDGSEDAGALVAVAAATAIGVSEVLARRRPDLLVVLGDRYELLGVATAALLQRVPLVHLHGGEVTEGAIDDSVRHAVTKLAHLHLCAAEPYAERIRQLGEEPWRIRVTGEPTIDRLHAQAAVFAAADVEAAVGVALVGPVGLLTYHPPTIDPDAAERELDALLAACDVLPTVIATLPGSDAGSLLVTERLSRWAAQRGGAAVVPSLGPLYPTTMSRADVVLGNSSSGIVEAPSFGVPVVNVGDRQLGRIRWAGVIDVPGELDAVRRAVEQALDPAFRRAVAAEPNPYGDGAAAPRIVEILAEEPLGPLLRKRFIDR